MAVIRNGAMAFLRGRMHINTTARSSMIATIGLKTLPETPPPNLKFSGTKLAPSYWSTEFAKLIALHRNQFARKLYNGLNAADPPARTAASPTHMADIHIRSSVPPAGSARSGGLLTMHL